MEFAQPDALKGLNELLQQAQIAHEEHVAPTPTAPTTVVSSATSKPPADPNNIWNEDEIPSEESLHDPHDTRPSPR